MGLERSSGKSRVRFTLRSFILFLENLALELGTNTEQTARLFFPAKFFRGFLAKVCYTVIIILICALQSQE